MYGRLAGKLIFLFLLTGLCSNGQTMAVQEDFLTIFRDTVKGECGYKDRKGDIVIPPGKYLMCYTDTFSTYAIVLVAHKGFVAIDRQEHELYGVFPFDNGRTAASQSPPSGPTAR